MFNPSGIKVRPNTFSFSWIIHISLINNYHLYIRQACVTFLKKWAYKCSPGIPLWPPSYLFILLLWLLNLVRNAITVLPKYNFKHFLTFNQINHSSATTVKRIIYTINSIVIIKLFPLTNHLTDLVTRFLVHFLIPLFSSLCRFSPHFS